MNKNVAFIMDRLPLQKGHSIHIVLPGVDGGYAVLFKAYFDGSRSKEDIEALLDLVVRELPSVVKEI